MTTGALIALEVFIGLLVVFGIYVGLHTDDESKRHKSKKKHSRL